MTNENFYQNQGSPLKAIIPSAFQYGGLMMGVAVFTAQVTKSKDSTEAIIMGLFGAGMYILGKGMEYAHRSDALSASFTHLEETLREEFKKNNRS